MNDTCNGFVGKTVARVEYDDKYDEEGRQDVFRLHFTDGSMLVVCENYPEIEWNGLEICASINEEVTND